MTKFTKSNLPSTPTIKRWTKPKLKKGESITEGLSKKLGLHSSMDVHRFTPAR
jgi:hypothetical protein